MSHTFKVFFISISLLSGMTHAATFTVSQDGRGQFTSIQAAVNAAGRGDIVRILDDAVYEEQVTVDSSKSGLTVTSANPLSSSKPSIVYQDTDNIHPLTEQESNSDSTINFHKNGALRVLKSRNITIDGLRIDGNEAFVFGADGVWEGMYPIQHGNAAVVVHHSGDVTIRNCDITNAYIGIYLNDQNIGGIYANANPADLQPWSVIPMSGFGKTGNHLIENNRIHHNSFGMLFESTWDLASTVRYNLFYENHHHSDAFAEQVRSLTSEGDNQPGGALWFKDHTLSPLAIYNNTFWHNYIDFCSHWRAGAQHLVFNNIHSSPNVYWSEAEIFENPYHTLSPAFPYRMKNCIYACKDQPPHQRTQRVYTVINDPVSGDSVDLDSTITFFDQVRIMNGITRVESEGLDIVLSGVLNGETYTETIHESWVIHPGALITDPFPERGSVRWLETDFEDGSFNLKLFKSTNPDDPDFLEPDWDNPYVQEFIMNAGWEDAGIRDADGSIADLGAIAQEAHPSDLVTIKPLSPVQINGTTAILNFDIVCKEGEFTDPQIKYFRFIETVEFQAESFGSDVDPIPVDAIHEMPSDIPVSIGSNILEVSIPARQEDDLYAFFEIVIEGTGSNGETVSSDVGFIPYRYITQNFLDVHVVDTMDTAQFDISDTIVAGDTVLIMIEAFSGDTYFNDTIAPAEITLNSSATLFNVDMEVLRIGHIYEKIIVPAVFTTVPQGKEYIAASGLWYNGDIQRSPFYGISEGLTILPASAEKVVFKDPISSTIAPNPMALDTGLEFTGQIVVYDRFDNQVNRSVEVTLSSLHPAIGDLLGGTQTIETDQNGVGVFTVRVTDGQQGDLFTLQAQLGNDNTDQADIMVGDMHNVSVIKPLGLQNRKPNMIFTVYAVNGREVFSGKAHSFNQITRLLHSRGLGTGVLLVKMQTLQGKPIGMRRLTPMR
ncbi:MAG: hypothetical protein ACLFSB_07165 [Chitinispirillaceae bacterium]